MFIITSKDNFKSGFVYYRNYQVHTPIFITLADPADGVAEAARHNYFLNTPRISIKILYLKQKSFKTNQMLVGSPRSMFKQKSTKQIKGLCYSEYRFYF